jgi:hypothetical protein
MAVAPRAVAATFLQIDLDQPGVSVSGSTEPYPAPQVLTITTPLADDSIAEVRYQLVLGVTDSGPYQVTSAGWTQRCQPNRGHQDFSTELCV